MYYNMKFKSVIILRKGSEARDITDEINRSLFNYDGNLRMLVDLCAYEWDEAHVHEIPIGRSSRQYVIKKCH